MRKFLIKFNELTELSQTYLQIGCGRFLAFIWAYMLNLYLQHCIDER